MVVDLSEQEIRALRRAASFLLNIAGADLVPMAREARGERVLALESAAMRLDLALLLEGADCE